jgi:pyruvate dehydrogenase E2 component (dihydrolipoamide acetyltransferase)
MPKLSDNMEHGTILRWLKRPGDRVQRGEPLAEVETDKADVEVEAADSGVLREIRVAEGGEAAVGEVIAVLAAEGEESGASAPAENPAAARKGGAEAGEKRAPAEDSVRAPTGPARATTPPRAEREDAPESEANRAPRASPLAWRVAEQAGVDLGKVRGSGPGGRIVKRDVEAAARRAAPARADERGTASAEANRAPDEAPEAARENGPGTGERIETPSRMRRTIARRMAEAKRDVPHFYVAAEIDMTEAMRLRDAIKKAEAMPDLTVTHLLLKAVAMALPRHPRVNASWRDESVVFHDAANIGVAVALEDGLVLPVLHGAEALSLGEIAERTGALVERARQGKFASDDLTGGTFSVSNVGRVDVDDLVAVINPPQAAILATGAVKERPLVRDGSLVAAPTMRATLSCDHRVLNGVEGARFLAEVKSLLEKPVLLVL